MATRVLLTLDWPADKAEREVGPLLQLLGLTAAESRMAVAVGAGLAVRDAAEANGVTESTARSTLRVIYAKLSISKQSELGQLVARLQFV